MMIYPFKSIGYIVLEAVAIRPDRFSKPVRSLGQKIYLKSYNS